MAKWAVAVTWERLSPLPARSVGTQLPAAWGTDTPPSVRALHGEIQQRFSFENCHCKKGIGLEGTTLLQSEKDILDSSL